MNKGYIIIINVLLLSVILAVVIVGAINPILSNFATSRSFSESKKAFMLSDSAVEEALYRLKNNKTLGSSSSITLASSTALISVVNTANGKDVTVTTPGNPYQKNIKLSLQLGTGVSFHFGIQGGQGGFEMNNSSSVSGNIFSSGPITGSGNYVYGDVISSGPSGLISGIHATGTAYAHTIEDSTIDRDAYYVTKTNTTVGGTSYPNSPDQDDVALPISDAQIEIWKADANAGSYTPCATQTSTHTISSNASLGPTRIGCNLLIKGNNITVTINGPVHVEGNIETQNSPVIKMSSALGNQNAAIIADNPNDRLTSSIITLGQNTTFEGSGTSGSYVFLISQNNSAENGGSVNAINVGQSSNALIAYASHGQITLSQSVGLKEVTAYKIVLNNTANVTYDKGLASSLFSAGPGGDYTHIEWSEF
jgi:Tfp pilus assembly protein PilX